MSAELERCLNDPGFTPPRAALGELLSALASLDEAAAQKVERALSRVGAALVGPVKRELTQANEVGRLRQYQLLGRIANTGVDPLELYPLLCDGLADPSTRCRRAAVVALGKVGDTRAEAPLLALFDGASPELSRSLVEALGKVGGAASLVALEALRSGDAELMRRAARARALLLRRQRRDEAAELAFDQPLPAATRVRLTCRRGLEGVLADELAHLGALETQPGYVELRFAGTLSQLLVARTALGVALAFPLSASEPDPRQRIADALTRPETLRALGAWTRGVIRFRFDFEAAGHQRALAWGVAEALTHEAAAIVNDPRAARWTASVPVSASGDLWLGPKLDPDPRFGYRKRDVPAASHPTIAAALARLSQPRADDVVWDPFMGSGLELIERAKLGPYARLIGSDLDPRALSAARENLASAEVADTETLLGDALTLRPAGVTSILSNPPMGRRVARDGSLRKLLEGFVQHAANVLSPGGRLVWLSPLDQRTERAARDHGFDVQAGPEVDLGGFSARVQTLLRR